MALSIPGWLSSLLAGPVETIEGYTSEERNSIAALVESFHKETAGGSWDMTPRQAPSGAALLGLPPRMAILAVECILAAELRRAGGKPETGADWSRERQARKLVSDICRRTLPFDSGSARPLLRLLARFQAHRSWPAYPALALTLLRAAKAGGWLEGLREEVAALCAAVKDSQYQEYAQNRKYGAELEKVLAEASGATLPGFAITQDAWGGQALADLDAMDAEKRARWSAVLAYAATAKGTRPPEKWLKAGARQVEAFGTESFAAQAHAWLAMLQTAMPRRDAALADLRRLLIGEGNADALKGLAWLLVHVPTESTAKALAEAALHAFRKIPNWGSRSAKLGNACVQTLQTLPGMTGARELAVLAAKIKQPSHSATIAKALRECAVRAGTSLDDIEELATPEHGFAAGTRLFAFGDYQARLAVDGQWIATQWSGPGGKPLKSAPAQVRKEFGEELKTMQRVVKDAQGALAAARDRLEKLPLLDRQWPIETWRARYQDHPLIGNLVKRLIWRFKTSDSDLSALDVDGTWIDEFGKAIDIDGTTVVPWHPVSTSADSVRRWRSVLAAHEITQPFKQAHREIYLLTDAERETRTYSNRFAAHIIRQHQFASLCLTRGWRYRLQGDFDSHNTPTHVLPKWGLRAEFWVEAPHEGGGLSGAGISLLLATDQVRFCQDDDAARANARQLQVQPVSLEQVPPIVFSEVMRDVDLFVGVCSVGTDPTWNDGGPEGRYRAYWRSVSFGDLTPYAETRREAIAALLPKLELRDVARIEGKFLIVKGRLRTYKIHVGSGNILMEPNDQYLCIVPDRSERDLSVKLPFEGDTVLSIVLSKALLLARDDRIKDPSIMRQINAA